MNRLGTQNKNSTPSKEQSREEDKCVGPSSYVTGSMETTLKLDDSKRQLNLKKVPVYYSFCS